MAKQQHELTVNESTDAFQVQQFLQRCKGIKKAYITTCQTLRVYYDDKIILAKTIAKLVDNIGKPKGGKRKTNIVSIREINGNNKTTAA